MSNRVLKAVTVYFEDAEAEAAKEASAASSKNSAKAVGTPTCACILYHRTNRQQLTPPPTAMIPSTILVVKNDLPLWMICRKMEVRITQWILLEIGRGHVLRNDTIGYGILVS